MTFPRARSGAVRRLLAGMAAVAFVATACGADDAADSTTAPTTQPVVGDSTTAASLGDVDGYPRTVEHANGSTVIEAPPERVVAIGITDETALLAFGVEPIGYSRWYGEGRDLSWPWNVDLWTGDLPVEITNDNFELMFERIADLDPDLIIGLWASADGTTYGQLSAIAPTVIRGEEGSYNNDWRESTRLAGEVFDQEARAEELIAAVDDGFAAFRAAHPELQGLTAAWVSPEDDGSVWYYADADSRGQFLSGLGFVADEGLEGALAGPGEFGAAISAEQLELLDGLDLLVVSADTAGNLGALQGNPLYPGLAPVAADHVTEMVGYDPPSISAAVSGGSALSLAYALERFAAELPATLG